jgi:anthranilate phosphoribosyltransferase
VTATRDFLECLLQRRDLPEADAAELLRALTAADAPPAVAGAVLAALRVKGVTANEVRGFAGAMRALARRPNLPTHADAIDIVGTGGDASGSLNLSTGAALLTAACGMPVIKHGNRSISSRSGSADLLESLGIKMPLDEVEAASCFATTNFVFLFAPYYHPAMKALAPVRTALGVRTIFNMLGPLMNPAAPRYHLIGAYDAPTAELMAHTLAGAPEERAWVVHGAAGWDEATPIGAFQVFDVANGHVTASVIDPLDYGVARCTAADLAGGDAQANSHALRAVFDNTDRGPHRAALTLQTGLALVIAGRCASVQEGIAAAATTLDSGRAFAWLDKLKAYAASRTA